MTLARALRRTRWLGAALLATGVAAPLPCVAQLVHSTLERRSDIAVGVAAARVRDSVGSATVAILGSELGFGRYDGAWAWGTAARLWVIPDQRGVRGAGLHGLVRASRMIGDIPALEWRGALGIGLSSVSVQRASAQADRLDLGFVYEAGITYEHRYRADAGMLFSLDAIAPTIGSGDPQARFPIVMLGVGFRRHRLEGREIPAPRGPRGPLPLPGRRPWPLPPEG